MSEKGRSSIKPQVSRPERLRQSRIDMYR